MPHITDAIQEWVERVAQQPVKGNVKPEVCVIELGGTIGDIEGMPFVEAFRQFQFRVKVSEALSVMRSRLNDFYCDVLARKLLLRTCLASANAQIDRRT